MITPHADPSRTRKTKWALVLIPPALLAVTVTMLLLRPSPKISPDSSPLAPAAISRTNLVLVLGQLCLPGRSNPFTGLMLEHAADGSLRSRSSVSNGLLHGLSEGWHTNGQLQVTEHFKEGLSHGLRTKWSPSGAKISEATIVEGKLHGTFRRWHENGVLSEQVEFIADQPQGTSLAYFPSGFLKARVTILDGRPAAQTFWQDGEFRE